MTLAIGGQTWLELAGLSYSSSTKNIDCARKEHVCVPERLHSIGNRQHASSAEIVVRGLKAEHVNIVKSHAEHVNIVEHEKKFQEHKRSEKCSTQAPKGIC